MEGSRQQPLPHSTKGFTILEVMIAMTLMAMIFSSGFAACFLGLKIIDGARDELRASQIVQSELEAMRTLNWQDLDDMPPSFTKIQPQGEFILLFPDRYRAYRQVIDINSLQKRVIVVVYWRSRGNDQWQSRLFNTVFTRGGLNDYFYRKV